LLDLEIDVFKREDDSILFASSAGTVSPFDWWPNSFQRPLTLSFGAPAIAMVLSLLALFQNPSFYDHYPAEGIGRPLPNRHPL
jgi:hypothetical protein